MICFLNKEIIFAFHEDQIKTYGGEPGIRDEGLLESALAQPKASFDEDYLHKNIFEMAAAYEFHVCKNHPFFNGNKRTALVAMYTFLYRNGFHLKMAKKSLYAVIIDLAEGKVEKKELASLLKEHCEER